MSDPGKYIDEAGLKKEAKAPYSFIPGDNPVRLNIETGEAWILARDYDKDGKVVRAMWIKIEETSRTND